MKFIICLAVIGCLQMLSVEAAETVYSVPLKDIDGKSATLKPYEGKVMLIVNVASHCGYTPQYTALEALHTKYQDKGFTVLGFPCNQFGAQESDPNEVIKQFCSSKYSVTFPLFDKIEVNGANRHPLYVMLAGKDSPYPGDIRWNFTKFLVGRDGKIVKRFDSAIKPDAPEVVQAVEAALAAK